MWLTACQRHVPPTALTGVVDVHQPTTDQGAPDGSGTYYHAHVAGTGGGMGKLRKQAHVQITVP